MFRREIKYILCPRKCQGLKPAQASRNCINIGEKGGFGGALRNRNGPPGQVQRLVWPCGRTLRRATSAVTPRATRMSLGRCRIVQRWDKIGSVRSGSKLNLHCPFVKHPPIETFSLCLREIKPDFFAVYGHGIQAG
jgi:hypothetical protein